MPDFWGEGVLTLPASSEMTAAFPITTLSTGMVSVLPSQVSGEIRPCVISPNKVEILNGPLDRRVRVSAVCIYTSVEDKGRFVRVAIIFH